MFFAAVCTDLILITTPGVSDSRPNNATGNTGSDMTGVCEWVLTRAYVCTTVSHRKLEHVNKISERKYRNLLVVPTVSTKVNDVSKQIAPLLLSNKYQSRRRLRRRHTPRRRYVLLSNSYPPKI